MDLDQSDTSGGGVDVNENEEDVFKILLATDIHLGFAEKDPERENDSFLAFEECLQYAVEHQVDFILHGGDLYHENKPSRTTQFRCIELLRKYCLGETPAAFEFLSSREATLSHNDSYQRLNYEDPNLNVAIPIFTIHGNHDDPAGHGGLCALDLLAAAGLVNFFGKTRAVDSIESAPLLMRKGATLLAIYGIGAMRDERLHRMFLQKRVTLLRPKERTDDFFNVLCIHQNRSKHGAKNFIPESFLDDFIDLVFWGHEHESMMETAPYQRNSARDFYVTQLGSTVATTLADGEAAPKHCALLKIKGKTFSMTPLKLKTVRQLYVEDLDLSKTNIAPDDPRCAEKVEKKCVEVVKRIIARAKSELTGDPRQPVKPLIRIKVDASGGYPVLFSARFGHQFNDSVANPKELLLFHKKRLINGAVVSDGGTDEELEGLEGLDINLNQLNAHRLEDIIGELMESPENKMSQLRVLTDVGLRRALEAFVDKEDKDALGSLMKHQIGRMLDFISANPNVDVDFDDESDVDRLTKRFHNERKAKGQIDEENDVMAMLQRNRESHGYQPRQPEDEQDDDDAPITTTRRTTPEDDEDDNNMAVGGDEDDDAMETTAAPAARGKRGGRGSRSGRGSRGGRGAASPAPATRGRGRGRGRGAAAASNEPPPVEDDDDVVINDAPPPQRKTAQSRAATSGNTRSTSHAQPDIRNLWVGNNANESLNTSVSTSQSQRRLPGTLLPAATSGNGTGFIDLTGPRSTSGQPQAKQRRPF